MFGLETVAKCGCRLSLVCASACLRGTTRSLVDEFRENLYTEGLFSEICRRKSGSVRIGQNDRHCTWRSNVHLWHLDFYEISVRHKLTVQMYHEVT